MNKAKTNLIKRILKPKKNKNSNQWFRIVVNCPNRAAKSYIRQLEKRILEEIKEEDLKQAYYDFLVFGRLP